MTRPRVVHAIRSGGFAGVERYVSDVSNALAERGWSVSVIGGDSIEMRRALAPEIDFSPATTTIRVISELRSANPTPLVHAHMSAAEAAAVLTKPLTQARVVSTRHFARARGGSILGKAAAGFVGRHIDLEIAISAFVSDALGGGQKVLLNGVRPEPASRGGRTVLIMQRLEDEKDTATAIKAFALSGLADQGWTLTLAGRGRQLEQLRGLAQTEGICASTDFRGFVSEPAALRATAGIFLASAPEEPFGLSVVEAMSAGLPVVAASGGAHLETLGETGFYFPAGDAEAAGRALRALGDSERARQLAGDKSRARHRQLLTLDGHVDRLEAAYAEVLA